VINDIFITYMKHGGASNTVEKYSSVFSIIRMR